MVDIGDTNFLIIIVGMPGAGKSTAAQYLQQKVGRVIRFGDLTIDELAKRGLSVNEANEKEVREDLRKKHGAAAFAKLMLPKIKEALRNGPVVIDGLYSWAEYKLLSTNITTKIFNVCIFVNRAIRYKRLAEREIRPLSLLEAQARDIAEIENLEKGGPIAFADYTVLNNDTETKLFTQIDKVLATM